MAYVNVSHRWFGLRSKLFVVVDGKEGEKYDGIGAGTLIFSADSQRVAYGARVGDKWFVVVDGKIGRRYNVIVRGGEVVFDSSDSLHYLAQRGSGIYLVEEQIE